MDLFQALNPVATFIAIAFSFTYALWGPAALAPPTKKWRTPFMVFGGAGPLIGAFLTSFLQGEAAGVTVADLVAQITTLPRLSTVGLALAVPLLLVAVPLALCLLINPQLINLSRAGKDQKSLYPEGYPGIALYFMLMLPCPMLLLEELGWRGFLTPTLRHQGCSPALSSLITGALWAWWHAPLFHPGPNPKEPGHSLAAETTSLIPLRLAVYTVTLATFSFVMSQLNDLSEGSIWVSVLVHGSYNSTFAIFKIERTARIFEPLLPVFILLAIYLTFFPF